MENVETSDYLRISKVCLIVGLFVIERHHWTLLVSDCLDLSHVVRDVQHLDVILLVLLVLVLLLSPLRRIVFIISSYV